MGTIYSVACRDCKLTRDLDKFYAMRVVADRKEALELSNYIAEPASSYRAALLVSFMWEHKGHNCTVFYEHDDDLNEELSPFYKNAKSDDRDFW